MKIGFLSKQSDTRTRKKETKINTSVLQIIKYLPYQFSKPQIKTPNTKIPQKVWIFELIKLIERAKTWWFSFHSTTNRTTPSDQSRSLVSRKQRPSVRVSERCRSAECVETRSWNGEARGGGGGGGSGAGDGEGRRGAGAAKEREPRHRVPGSDILKALKPKL